MASRTRSKALAGRYVLGPTLGVGGMGEVVEAEDLRTGRQVAVKLLQPWVAGDRGEAARLTAEARLARRVRHPNVVEVLDAGTDGQPFIVMERLSGRTLRDRLADGRIDEAGVRALGLQLLAGLSAIHRARVAHRDLKPGNVLEGPEGTWKVGDFGIATSLATQTTMTVGAEALGSLPYVAPERLEDQPTTPATDLYGVGAILFEALAGRSAFEQDDPALVAVRIRAGNRPRLGTLVPGADPALVAAIERALAVDPDDRFASAEEMARALGGEDATRVLPIPGAGALGATTTVLPPMAPTRRLEPVPLAAHPRATNVARGLAAAAAVVLVAILTWAAFAGGDPVPASTARRSAPPTSAATSAAAVVPTAEGDGQGDGQDGAHGGHGDSHHGDHGNHGDKANGKAKGHDH